MFVTSQGSAHARFRRALLTQNVALIDAAARELPRVALEDALRVLVVLSTKRDERYPRAAARFAQRLIFERRLSVDDARRVLALVEVLPTAPDGVGDALRGYCG
jgi:hypothetical protein